RWDNPSVLSPLVEATTNEGPKIELPATGLKMTADVVANPLADSPLILKNTASGMLQWKAQFFHTSQQFTKFSTDTQVQIQQADIAPGKIRSERTEAPDAVVRAVNSLSQQRIMRYGQSRYFVIGDSEPVNDHFAATMFVSDGLNLTDVYAFLKHDNQTGPIRVEIMLGNVFGKDKIIHSQEFLSSQTQAYEHKMRLDRQINIPKGSAFWINIVVPKGNKYPLGIATETLPENSSYCFMSIDGGKTFSKLEDALRGGFNYPETAVWDVAAVSANGYFGEFIKLSAAEGTVAGNSADTITVQADGKNLINGIYNSFIEFSTNDPMAKVLTHPLTFTVTGQKPKLVSEKIVNFSDVFVGANKTIDIEVANEGLGAFNIASVTSSNPAFSRQNYISTINAHDKNIMKIRFAPKTEGSQSSTITIKGTKGESYQFTVYGIGCVEGKLAYTPEVLQVGDIKTDGETKSLTMKLRNIGKYPLEYAFVNYAGELEGDLANIASRTDANKYGYRMLHNINNPSLNVVWTDISGIGENITSQFSARERAVPVHLGFSLPFYQQSYDSLYITDCGILSSHRDVPLTVCLPPSASEACWLHSAVISGCGFPLKFNKQSRIYVHRTSGKLIVSYENMGIDNPQYMYGLFDFQMVLQENGNIDIVYRNINYEVLSNLYAFFIGMCNEGSTDPFVINEMDRMLNIDGDRNTDDFQPQMSFRILYPGKTVVEQISEPKGMLQIGEEKELTLDMRFAGLSKGAFSQNLNILTTNPLTPMAHFQVEGNMDIEGKSELFISPKEEIKGLSCLRTQKLKGEIQISNKGTAPMVINEITASDKHLLFEPVSEKEIAPNTTYLFSFDCETSVVGDFS
ncbi:MAG: choice-of-anchor D domain-containing protein, partial [Bacteroidales bacterium]